MKPVLDDVSVIDLSTFVTGGFSSLMLAAQGADVIKIERPDVGDDIRHSGPPFINGESPYYWTVNYDKRSIELNLKTEPGKMALYDLVEAADVVIQNFRPGTADRLDIAYDDLTKYNDSLIYCDISAFGNTGPWSERPGYDLLVQGLSGIMSVTGEADSNPAKVGLPQTDLITGMWAAFGIMGALYRRERTDEGEYIELGMLDATLPWLTKQAGKVFADETPERMGTQDPVLAPYQTLKTGDGYINIACLNEKLWQALCDAIERPDLSENKRFETNADRVENMDALAVELETALSERTTDEWMTVFTDAGVPAGPVQTVADALSNEQTDARGMINTITDGNREIPVIEHPLNFKNAQSGFDAPPPKLGEHTNEVFAELGYTEQKLEHLRKKGVFGNNDSE
ncbi:CaiB/BaiF CoA transferase family protein [Haloquadratum walsbyi]|uniref:Family 3 CoA transferase n=1 Tax=Haloquadratum walsbyi (strain DSM 16854 / JCM 12705 / C23) TaxID=768065 RepID=G0LKP7_HALWC|nr:CaiB/BaiF CoA-transferase family protein [Haloquadratum walsbyi]CCC40005.1 family 3 CoA transferase [Haloquadratum walsbyi C23]